MTQDEPVPGDADGTSAAAGAEPTRAAAPPAATPAGPRIRWQDRVMRLPSVIAVALATLIVGGLGGLGLGAIVHHRHGDEWRHGHMGDRMGRVGGGMGGWGDRDGHPGGWGQPGMMPGPQGRPGGGPQQGAPEGGQGSAPTAPAPSTSQNSG